MSTFGDIPSRQLDPNQPYYDALRQSRTYPGENPITRPPSKLPADDPLRMLINKLTTDKRLRSDVIEITREIISSCLFYTKAPNWVTPPITSRNVDIFTDCDGITLPATDPDTTVTLLSFRVPDRNIAVFTRFGHALEDATAFPEVDWEFTGTKQEPAYSPPFCGQIGQMLDPFIFPMPIIRKGGETINITATNTGAAAHTAFARLTGFMYAPKDITDNGSYNQFFTL